MATKKGEYGTVPDPTQPWIDEHRDLGDGGYRAAIFGFMDGLVTNLCLILGVQFALEEELDEQGVIVTGLAGIISGSFSMSVGEYISMLAEREALKSELKVERQHLIDHEEVEEQELKEIFKELCFKDETIDAIITDLRKGDYINNCLSLHARLELGIDPDDTGGNPIKAGAASFISWVFGAFTPMLPYFFFRHEISWIITIVICSLSSLILGIVLAYFSGLNKIYSGVRQFIAVVLSAGSALLIGYIVSVIKDATE